MSLHDEMKQGEYHRHPDIFSVTIRVTWTQAYDNIRVNPIAQRVTQRSVGLEFIQCGDARKRSESPPGMDGAGFG